SDAVLFYRTCIEAIIDKQVIWRRLVTLGRRKFVSKLSRNEEQCFWAAGLMDSPAPSSVVEWWDGIIERMRCASNLALMQRARKAEMVSLQWETIRLKKLGIDRVPTWMSLEDNTVGYDILSYDIGLTEPVNGLIEVKSTVYSPLRFHVS